MRTHIGLLPSHLGRRSPDRIDSTRYPDILRIEICDRAEAGQTRGFAAAAFHRCWHEDLHVIAERDDVLFLGRLSGCSADKGLCFIPVKVAVEFENKDAEE